MIKSISMADRMRRDAELKALEALATNDPSRAKYLNAVAESMRKLANAIEPRTADAFIGPFKVRSSVHRPVSDSSGAEAAAKGRGSLRATDLTVDA